MNDQEKILAVEGGSYRFRTRFDPNPKFFFPSVAVIAIFIWWGVHYAVAWYWIAFPCLGIFVAGCSVSRRYTIDPAHKVVREQSLLFGRRHLSERLVPFSDFNLVLVEKGNASGEDGIVFHVSLRHTTGRKLFLKYFHTPREAEELAWRISCDTGIQLKGEPA